MSAWTPASPEKVAAIVAEQLRHCTELQRRRFERIRIPIEAIPIDHNGKRESAYVVARVGSRVVFWDAVEEGFELAAPDEDGVLRRCGASQLDLSQMLHQLTPDARLAMGDMTWHIGRVRASVFIAGSQLDPALVSRATGITPTDSAAAGDERKSVFGAVVGRWREGWWELSSQDFVISKDLNDHIAYLTAQLLPHRAALRDQLPGVEVSISVFWESSYLYAGTGPTLTVDCLRDVAALGACIDFDICAVEDGVGEEPLDE